MSGEPRWVRWWAYGLLASGGVLIVATAFGWRL